MLFKRLLFLFFILFNHQSFSQDIIINWGISQPLPNKSPVKKIIAETEDGLFALRLKYGGLFESDQLFIEQYSPVQLKLIKAIPVILPLVEEHKTNFENIFYLKDKFVVASSRYDKSVGRNIAYLQTISFESGPSAIVKADEILAPRKKNTGDFDFVLSPDRTKLLVYHNDPYEKYSNEKFSYKVFDSDLNELWSKQIELPYKDKNFKVSGYQLDNESNVYMLSRVTVEEESAKYNKYSILALFQKNKEIREYDIHLKNKPISDISFSIAPNGDLVAAGFYSNNASSEYNISGTFFLRVDEKTKEVVSSSTKDFEKEFLTQFMSDRRARKNKALYNYNIDYIFLDSVGGATVIAEQFYENTVCTSDPRTGYSRCNYYYYYNDIIVIKIAPDGTILWTKKIPKGQVSVNDNGPYSSYFALNKNNDIYLIFNDNPKNINTVGSGKTLNNFRKSVAVMVTITNEGKIIKNLLYDSSDQKIILRPKTRLRSGTSSIIMYGQKGKIYKFGKITF